MARHGISDRRCLLGRTNIPPIFRMDPPFGNERLSKNNTTVHAQTQVRPFSHDSLLRRTDGALHGCRNNHLARYLLLKFFESPQHDPTNTTSSLAAARYAAQTIAAGCLRSGSCSVAPPAETSSITN